MGQLEIRHDPENPDRIAIGTGPRITAGAWFLFDINHGGFYTDGNLEGINDWPVQ